MKHLVIRLAFAFSALVPVSSALAADLDVPPPVDDLRPTLWSGPYVGAFFGGASEEGVYTCPCFVDPEMSGQGYHAGFMAGWNYQIDDFVLGFEGDWAFGGQVADNDDPVEATYLNFNDIATLRARAGWADGNTLFYATGGLAAVNAEFGGLVGPLSEDISDSKWVYGWTVGGGIEHAFTDNVHARLEYLYVSLPDTDYTLIASDGSGGTLTQDFENIHMVRAGVTYNFVW